MGGFIDAIQKSKVMDGLKGEGRNHKIYEVFDQKPIKLQKDRTDVIHGGYSHDVNSEADKPVEACGSFRNTSVVLQLFHLIVKINLKLVKDNLFVR